jgi:prepilin-type processing-associated H-X9-DG protein
MTAFEEPARLFAFGDTYDTPRMTLGAVDDWITYTLPNGFNDNAQLRYGGKFNMGFADGHAKIVRYKGGVADSPVGRVAVPRDYNERLYGYCAQLDGMIIPFIRSGNTTAIPCRQVVALPEAYNVVWWKN